MTSNNNRTTFKEFYKCLRIGFCNVKWFVFLNSWTPLLWGDYNFLISNSFFMIVSVLNAPRGGPQVLFRHKKQQNPPLGSSLPWTLKCWVIGGTTLHKIDNFKKVRQSCYLGCDKLKIIFGNLEIRFVNNDQVNHTTLN